MTSAPTKPQPLSIDRQFAQILRRFAVPLLGLTAVFSLVLNPGAFAMSPISGPNFADSFNRTKLNQIYNEKGAATKTIFSKMSDEALKAGIPKQTVDELKSELDEIYLLLDKLEDGSPVKVILDRIDMPKEGDEKKFEVETTRHFDEFLGKAARAFSVKNVATNGGGQPAPVPSPVPEAKPAPQTVKVELPAEFDKKFDVLADPTMKDKIASTLSRQFFPNGEPAELNDFDQLIEKKELDAAVDSIVDYANKLISSRLKANTGFQNLVKKSGIDTNAFLAKIKEKYKKPLTEMAQEILANRGHIDPKWDTVANTVWAELGEDFVDKLNELLEKSNDKYNDGKDTAIARESKTKRADRLFMDAVKHVVDELALNSEKDIDPFSQARLKSYAFQAAAPKTDVTTPEPTVTTEETTDIDQFKSTVFSKMRLIYRELGGFGNVMGVFGLKGYLAGIIIDALVQRLDRNLTDAERAKAHGWAAELEREFQGDTAPQRPGPVIQQPVPTNPYPQWPVPTVPYVYGRMGHKLGHHQRPVMYVMPGMGGYVVMPR